MPGTQKTLNRASPKFAYVIKSGIAKFYTDRIRGFIRTPLSQLCAMCCDLIFAVLVV